MPWNPRGLLQLSDPRHERRSEWGSEESSGQRVSPPPRSARPPNSGRGISESGAAQLELSCGVGVEHTARAGDSHDSERNERERAGNDRESARALMSQGNQREAQERQRQKGKHPLNESAVNEPDASGADGVGDDSSEQQRVHAAPSGASVVVTLSDGSWVWGGCA